MSDLITSKLKEFENLPANVLGIDGWILRSVPHAQRKVFLGGYLKLMRIVFHPDHCPSPEARAARENLIKTMAEAVEYLNQGEMEYESATECVPAKKNFMVKLKQEAEDHQQAKETVFMQLAEEKRKAEDLAASLKDTETKLRNATNLHYAEGLSWIRRRNHLGRRLEDFAYPTTINCRLQGQWLLTEAPLDHQTAKQIAQAMLDVAPSCRAQALQQHIQMLEKAGALSKRVSITVEGNSFEDGDKRYTLRGTMGFLELGEWIRGVQRYKPLDKEEWIAASQFRKAMQQLMDDKTYADQWRGYVMPILQVGLFAWFGGGRLLRITGIEPMLPAKVTAWQGAVERHNRAIARFNKQAPERNRLAREMARFKRKENRLRKARQTHEQNQP